MYIGQHFFRNSNQTPVSVFLEYTFDDLLSDLHWESTGHVIFKGISRKQR